MGVNMKKDRDSFVSINENIINVGEICKIEKMGRRIIVKEFGDGSNVVTIDEPFCMDYVWNSLNCFMEGLDRSDLAFGTCYSFENEIENGMQIVKDMADAQEELKKLLGEGQ